MGSRKKEVTLVGLEEQKRALQASMITTENSGETWIGWFARIIREFGGEYKVWRDFTGGTVKITGRRLIKSNTRFVKEMKEGMAKATLKMMEGSEDVAFHAVEADQIRTAMHQAATYRKQLSNVYYRDRHGSLRRVLAK